MTTGTPRPKLDIQMEEFDTIEQAAAYVRQMLDAGYDFVQIEPSIDDGFIVEMEKLED